MPSYKEDNVPPYNPKLPKGGRKSGKRMPPRWRENFLASLRRCPFVSQAVKAAKVSVWFAYAEMYRSAKFKKAVEKAQDEGWEAAEATLYQSAFKGQRKPVWMKDQNGKPKKVDETYELNTTAAIFMLKARYPHKYRDNVVLTGPDGGALKHEFTVNLSAAEVQSAFKPKALGEGDGAVDVDTVPPANGVVDENGKENG